MSILSKIADIITEMDFSDEESESLIALHREFKARTITYNNCMRIPGFRKLYVAIMTAAAYNAMGPEEFEDLF